MNAAPRILLWDLETTFNVVATFRLDNEDRIPHRNILKERYIICACWKWLGEKRVYSTYTASHNDLAVVKTLAKVILQADAIVAHNGRDYDEKFLNGRLLFHGQPTLPPILSLDTLKLARQKFYLNSNRLDYLGQYLSVGKKRDTETDLWLKVLQGSRASRLRAIKQMVKYNVQDVLLLERVFLRLKPYMANYVNRQLFGCDVGGTPIRCPECGSRHSQAGPDRRTATRVYKRYRCLDCHRWYIAAKAEKSPTVTTRPV